VCLGRGPTDSNNSIHSSGFSVFSVIWGICFSLKPNLNGIKTSDSGTVLAQGARLLHADACKAGALPAELHSHKLPHDYNGFLVGMTSCFSGRHSSSTKSSTHVQSGTLGQRRCCIYQGSDRKPTSILRFAISRKRIRRGERRAKRESACLVRRRSR